jgi:phosphoserine phosphatase RsbU/P
MKPFNSRVLIIDDDESIREAYQMILTLKQQPGGSSGNVESNKGWDRKEAHQKRGPYDIVFADSGESGIKEVEKGVKQNQPFAVIFVDMMMTGIDGAETAREIWKIDPRSKIIIVTASSEYKPGEIVQVTNRDDIFYLRKPFKSAEIVQFARALTSQWNLEQEKEQLSSELAQARQQEIETASAIQRTLLLGKQPEGLQGVEISQKTIASQEVDGDFYDFYSFKDRCLDVVVGDVMGKGVAAALLGAALKSQILYAINIGIISSADASPAEPKEIISAVHSEMITQLEELESFVTLCYARFDLERSRLSLVDCGHTRTIHFDRSLKQVRLLQGENTPLGFPVFEAFSQVELEYSPGDIFFFYSDGLTEARNPSGDFFGEERLVQLVSENRKDNPDQLIESVYRQVLAFSQSGVFNDDLTFVVVKIDEDKEDKVVTEDSTLEIESDYAELKKVREFTRSFCKNILELEQEQREQMVLVVNEIVTNIIKHSYQEKPGEHIRLNFIKTRNQVVFEFVDSGDKPFSPGPEEPSLPDEDMFNGRGLFIIKNLVDDIRYSRDDNGKNRTCATLNL